MFTLHLMDLAKQKNITVTGQVKRGTITLPLSLKGAIMIERLSPWNLGTALCICP